MSDCKNKIPVLVRAVEVMEYIASHPGRVSQPELIAALKIPQATCYRIIATLVAANWLVKLPGNKYDIAPAIARLSRKTELQLEKYRPLQPALDYIEQHYAEPFRMASEPMSMAAEALSTYTTEETLESLIATAKKDMEEAAKRLDFAAATRHRDRMRELEAMRK